MRYQDPLVQVDVSIAWTVRKYRYRGATFAAKGCPINEALVMKGAGRPNFL